MLRGCAVQSNTDILNQGHPLGATGLAQCAELCWQLRGWANNRLVDCDVALQHNLGLGGAVVVNVYKRADGKNNRKMSDQEVVRTSAFDYNPAVQAKTPSPADIDKVRSKTARCDYALGDSLKKLEARL